MIEGIVWQMTLTEHLPRLGHRNWIVIADAAYPWQSAPGIETIDTGSDHIEVIQTVLTEISQLGHVRPVVFMDAELPHVAESDAPGVEASAAAIAKVLEGQEVHSVPHHDIIAHLDEAGRTFQVVIFKSTLKIPYTSVFIQLDCGYWSDEAEKRLRASMS